MRDKPKSLIFTTYELPSIFTNKLRRAKSLSR